MGEEPISHASNGDDLGSVFQFIPIFSQLFSPSLLASVRHRSVMPRGFVYTWRSGHGLKAV